MKKSQLKNEIKNHIYEILSETDLDPKGGSVVMSKQSNPTDIKKYTEKGIDVQLKEQDNTLTGKVDYIAQALEQAWFFGSRKTKVDFKDMAESIVYDLDELFTENLNESEEDSSPDDETIDKQAKAAAKKEKIQGPSKFKFTNTEFEDFKTKLKNLVTKIKNMEKGTERDKKMAALKQFIKKPELVKAFKERDVKIDTGGLVGESQMKINEVNNSYSYTQLKNEYPRVANLLNEIIKSIHNDVYENDIENVKNIIIRMINGVG